MGFLCGHGTGGRSGDESRNNPFLAGHGSRASCSARGLDVGLSLSGAGAEMPLSVIAYEGTGGRVKAAVTLAACLIPGRGPWLQSAIAVCRPPIFVARRFIHRIRPVCRIDRAIGRIDIDTFRPAWL